MLLRVINEQAERSHRMSDENKALVRRYYDEILNERKLETSTMTGTHDGEYKGIPPTGRHISADSAEVFRIVDGKFAGYWCLANVAGLMRQLTEEPVAATSAGGAS